MKINPNFPYDMFKFIHKPIRTADVDQDNFLERYMNGMQNIWEGLSAKIEDIQTLNNPEKIRADLLYYLKDIVGLTRDLRNITDSLSEADLRKVILLAVPLWKSKGLEIGFKNIIKLFTGFNTRVFNWFDYRMIIGEKAIGEEQLGEDSWLISRPGVQLSEPESLAYLMLQFNDQKIKDGSEYDNIIIPYGDYFYESGGAFSSSDFYYRGIDTYFRILNKALFDFTNNWSFELFIKNSISQVIPLIYKWDTILNKGIKLILDTTTAQITYTISDGVTTQTGTYSTVADYNDGYWKHIAWVVNWTEGNDGKLAIWANGNRIALENITGAFIKDGINNLADIFICAGDSVTGCTLALDGIRFTGDARYDVDLASITSPGTNFIEYQAEQLDEFQIDIRVVDDGTLDRTMLKRILNLMRPVSERLNILYIDFYDSFENGKGQFKTISGNAYVEDTDAVYYMKLPELSLEHVDVQGGAYWKNYMAQLRCTIYEGNQFEVRFLIQDDLNYYSFRVDSLSKLAHIEKTVAGVRSAMASPVTIDIETATPPIYLPYYVFMVSTFKNENTGVITLKTYIDSNQIFSVDDTSFEQGTFGLYTYANTVVWCSETEMFQLPLEYDRIDPNSEF